MGKFKEFWLGSTSRSIIETNREIRKALELQEMQYRLLYSQEKAQRENGQQIKYEQVFINLTDVVGGVDRTMELIANQLEIDLKRKRGIVELLSNYPEEKQKTFQEIARIEDALNEYKNLLKNITEEDKTKKPINE